MQCTATVTDVTVAWANTRDKIEAFINEKKRLSGEHRVYVHASRTRTRTPRRRGMYSLGLRPGTGCGAHYAGEEFDSIRFARFVSSSRIHARIIIGTPVQSLASRKVDGSRRKKIRFGAPVVMEITYTVYVMHCFASPHTYVLYLSASALVSPISSSPSSMTYTYLPTMHEGAGEGEKRFGLRQRCTSTSPPQW